MKSNVYMKTNKNLHLLWRAGFGPDLKQLTQLNALSKEEIWQSLKTYTTAPLQLSNTFVKEHYKKIIDPLLSKQDKEVTGREIRQQSGKDLKELNDQWISRMVKSPDQLYEKICFFWHGHFAIRQNNSYLQLQALNKIREHALGNFGTLLREISKSGAMIISLNNQQNKKTAPNENFAREIMELFSMGMGQYTEKDIKEAARAFTGWSMGFDGQFIFRPFQHYKGPKTIFGKTGNFVGDDVIDLILQQPQTARFIVEKIYRFFVNEKSDEKRIDELAKGFRKDYEILPLLENIFMSDWFYEQNNIGNKIKSPIELLAGIQRSSPFTHIGKNIMMPAQKLLGQILFYPPSIAGWPMGKGWIDSSTIMVRLQLPKVLNGSAGIRIKAKTDDDTNMGRDQEELNIMHDKGNTLNLEWAKFIEQKNQQELLSYFILSTVDKEKLALLQHNSKKEWVISLMSLPEYQLC